MNAGVVETASASSPTRTRSPPPAGRARDCQPCPHHNSGQRERPGRDFGAPGGRPPRRRVGPAGPAGGAVARRVHGADAGGADDPGRSVERVRGSAGSGGRSGAGRTTHWCAPTGPSWTKPGFSDMIPRYRKLKGLLDRKVLSLEKFYPLCVIVCLFRHTGHSAEYPGPCSRSPAPGEASGWVGGS